MSKQFEVKICFKCFRNNLLDNVEFVKGGAKIKELQCKTICIDCYPEVSDKLLRERENYKNFLKNGKSNNIIPAFNNTNND
jgi:hypothetical protein